MSERLVIIPTYNEKENIEKIIRVVFELPLAFDILIVDDGSPDGTAEIVRNLQKTNANRLFLEERKEKSGLGTAYIHGFKWGLAKGYAYFFEMDADFSHPPEALIALYDLCAEKGADVSVGSRYVRHGKVRNWPLDRLILSFGASMYVRLITWMPVRDPTAGFVCYTRKVLETLDLDNIQFVGYAFQIEMKFKAWSAGFRIMEYPITFTDREEGESKMSAGIIHEAVFGVLKLKLDAFRSKVKPANH